MAWFGPSGDCGCCNDRPCCSDVWDLVRAEYSAMNFTAEGPTSFDDDIAIVESSGGTFQCAVAADEIEADDSTETLVTSGIYRIDSPDAESKSRLLGGVGVSGCDPSPSLRVSVFLYYWLRYTGAIPDWTALGFSTDGFLATDGAFKYINYSRTDGDIITGIRQYYDATVSVPQGTRVSATYQEDFTPTLPDSVPFPLTVAPQYNPAGFSVTLDWVV